VVRMMISIWKTKQFLKMRFSKMPYVMLAIVLSVLTGCSAMDMNQETPELRLVSIQKLPAGTFEQGFMLGFKIINPTDKILRAKGMSFSIELEGYELIKGVHNQIPEIKPYSEGEFNAKASVNLINSIRFFAELLNHKKGDLEYRLTARVDTMKGGVPPFTEKREGTISLQDAM